MVDSANKLLFINSCLVNIDTGKKGFFQLFSFMYFVPFLTGKIEILLLLYYFYKMQSYTIQQLAGNTDIYLLDQILKDRYGKLDIVLDAGCGNGRNLQWFLINQIDCYAIDMDPFVIEALKIKYPILSANRFQTAIVDNLPFPDHFFDHIISCAVLHFAQNVEHLYAMLKELARVLKPGGTLFIRMASNIGMEHSIESVGDGVYAIPDGSVRFLLSKPILENILRELPFRLLEALKTVNVADIRCMTTLMMQKQ